MIEIEYTDKVPDNTYFRLSEVQPQVEGNVITLFRGKGTRRSWGQPFVNSYLIYRQPEFVAILVGCRHKHGGGQGWFYFRQEGDRIERVKWPRLHDSLRIEILAGWNNRKDLHWSKPPGKLRSGYKKPKRQAVTTYKAIDAERWRSLYDPTVIYELGHRLTQAVGTRAGENEYGEAYHDGGFYSHRKLDTLLELLQQGKLVPKSKLEGVKTLAIIKCQASGRIVYFPTGKLASTYIKPIRVVKYVNPQGEEVEHALS